MADSSTAPTYLTNLFATGVYHIEVDGVPYKHGEVYATDAAYKVVLNDGVADKLPLALLFASMQIGLAEVASCKAESYMNKIVNNQEIQIACSSAINEAKKMQDASSDTVFDYINNNYGWTTVTNLPNTTITPPTYTPNDGESETVFDIDEAKLAKFLKENGVEATKDMQISCSGKTGPTDDINGNWMYIDTSYTCTVTANCVKEDKTVGTYTFQIEVKQRETYHYANRGKGSHYETTTDTIGTEFNIQEGTSASSINETTLTQSFVDSCKDANITEFNGVELSTSVNLTDDQLDELIKDLEVAQDKATTTTQTDMVYAEDYLGQYNSYLNGGSSNIDDLTNALQTIAQRI